MSDNGPESLTLRHLRALDERLARVEDALTGLVSVVGARFGALEARMMWALRPG